MQPQTFLDKSYSMIEKTFLDKLQKWIENHFLQQWLCNTEQEQHPSLQEMHTNLQQ